MFEEKQRTMTDSPSPIGGNSPEEGHYPTDPDLDVLVGSHRVRPIIKTGSDLSEEKNPEQTYFIFIIYKVIWFNLKPLHWIETTEYISVIETHLNTSKTVWLDYI